MATMLITGCSRGLGLEMTKHLAKIPSSTIGTIFATARSPTPPAALEEVIKSSPARIKYIQLDALSKESVSAAVAAVTSHLPASKGLDILVNNAGIQIFEGTASQMHSLDATFATNVTAVHTVTAAFLPLLSAAPGGQRRIANVTSSLGSIAFVEYAEHAPFPAYKVSKAALNMMTAQYALELGPKGFTVAVINPGWSNTDLGGEGADLRPEEAAGALLDVVFKLTPQDNGKFKNISVPGKFFYKGEDLYDGKDIPW